jgi:hypothetical protein
MVSQCAKTEALDGFLYNTCLLAIERSIRHKQSFVRVLAIELNNSRQRRVVSETFIAERIACHVDVLIHTSHIDPVSDL